MKLFEVYYEQNGITIRREVLAYRFFVEGGALNLEGEEGHVVAMYNFAKVIACAELNNKAVSA